MKIYNKGGRIFQHDDVSISPDTFKEVPDGIAEKWLADYPKEIVAADDHRKAMAGAAVALAAKEEELAAVKAADAEKELKIKALEEQLANFAKLTKEESPFPAAVKVEMKSGRNR
jgi:uncharacterized protein YhdP